MKKTAITLIFSLAAVAGALAQGTVEFDNLTTGNPATSPKIFAPDGTTGLDDSYVAQLLYVPGGAADPVVLGASLPFFASSTGGNGFLNTSSGAVRTITGVTGTANLMVQAWRLSDGATYADAANAVGGQYGQSAVFSQTLGGPDPSGGPDLLAGKLVNLQSFSLTMNAVPEPSIVALGAIGLGLLALRKRSA